MQSGGNVESGVHERRVGVQRKGGVGGGQGLL